MSIGNFSPVTASLAGTQLAERQSSVDRQTADARAHDRKVDSQTKAAEAQGLGGDDKESEAASGDRDADGRQAWRWSQQQRRQKEGEPRPRDLSGKVGQNLDLDG